MASDGFEKPNWIRRMNNLKNGCLKNIDFIFGEQKKTPNKYIRLKGGQFSCIKKKEPARLSARVSHTIIKVELMFSRVTSACVNPSHCLISLKG